MSGDLIDTTEMYLKTVFELEEQGIPPMRARIAERLGHSGPTVSQTVARMERDGLLTLDDDRRIHLTPAGQATATAVMRKHRLAERHLQDHLGLDYVLLHDEACRWEHVMSEAVERRIAERIRPPFVDPYGNPIPGLDELGVVLDETAATPPGQEAVKSLLSIARPDHVIEVEVHRLGERLQSDMGLLRELTELGVHPGGRLHVRRAEGAVEVGQVDGGPATGRLLLDDDTASQISGRVLTGE
ncbi:metal-dependent transcriptional regulator [Brachybacterium sp. EF45031]|uniref:metal-dependent transcriptional regulator n=1 Tax=Brachybacterium sillae TaxID=2810536 RepID=UPI00217EA343|nr:metal-dependent transcriptional regulator [Brachybacterium sillae]MCS6711329.1 metal-dependent transcriptional regulator [Brachybacterium sillae]